MAGVSGLVDDTGCQSLADDTVLLFGNRKDISTCTYLSLYSLNIEHGF